MYKLLFLNIKEFKSNLNGGTETERCLEMYSAVTGQSVIDDPIFLISEAPTYLEAAHKAFNYLSKMKNILTREQRRYPEMFEYLGWCSWDAMKTDVNEIDDGFFPAENAMI